MLNKFRLWLISTSAMWSVILIKTWKVPICWTFWQGFEWAPIGVIFSTSNIVAYMSIVCLLIGYHYLRIYDKRLDGSPTSLPIIIKEITDRSQDYINSLATLVTLFAVLIVNYETWRDLLVLAIMLAVIFVSYTQTNLYYANPVMALLKYKIAEVQTHADCKELPSGSVVLYRRVLNVGDKVSPYHIADNVYIVI